MPIRIELLRYRLYGENILSVEPENFQKVRVSTSGIIRKAAKAQKDEAEKQRLLNISKGSEAAYSQELAQKRAKAAEM